MGKPYLVALTCGNCGDSRTHELSFGTYVSLYIAQHACERCGCKSLRAAEWRPG